jgi:signal transduction histidine kinase
MGANRPTSIATKLTRMNMLVSTTALLLACAGFVAYDVASFRESIVTNLSSQARLAGSNVISALTFDDPPTAQRTLATFKLTPHIISARIFTAAGKPFATYRRDGKAQVPDEPQIAADQEEGHTFTSSAVTLTRAIVFDGKVAGYIFIESDLRALIARIDTYLRIAAAVLGLSLLGALFVSRMARRSIAKPIVTLAAAAGAVSREKNYGVRVALGGVQGELALLIATFNEMVEQIEARDITLQAAHDDLERRVDERTKELALANKELESFSYSVSHDLRAPLRSIDGFSLALEEDYGDKLDEAGKRNIHRVRAASQRMGVLIDDLLNLSRLSRLEMERERVDLSKMAKTVATELAGTDEAREIDWVIKEGIETYGDQRLLRVVMDNLLGNAWKYSSKHARARIEFGEQDNSGSPVFFVKDDGAGFDSAYYDKLFAAFQRLHGITEFPGTGVGLATVQRIVRRHNGSVWAESAVEKGATFYFTVGENNGGSNGEAAHSADRGQSGRRRTDTESVAKEQYQE